MSDVLLVLELLQGILPCQIPLADLRTPTASLMFGLGHCSMHLMCALSAQRFVKKIYMKAMGHFKINPLHFKFLFWSL